MCIEQAESSMVLQKRADFMLKMAEKLYSAVIAGALGATPLFHWLEVSQQQKANATFAVYMALLTVGTIAAIYLQLQAEKTYRRLGSTS